MSYNCVKILFDKETWKGICDAFTVNHLYSYPLDSVKSYTRKVSSSCLVIQFPCKRGRLLASLTTMPPDQQGSEEWGSFLQSIPLGRQKFYFRYSRAQSNSPGFNSLIGQRFVLFMRSGVRRTGYHTQCPAPKWVVVLQLLPLLAH